MAIGTFPTQEFATYAATQVSGALGAKKKYVIVQADETKAGIWSLYFFDGDILRDPSPASGSAPDLSGYTTLNKDVVPINANTSAIVDHVNKIIELDASGGNITYTIDPAILAGYELTIRRSDASANTATIAQSTGNMELISGDTPTNVGLQSKETITLYSDGSKLKQL